MTAPPPATEEQEVRLAAEAAMALTPAQSLRGLLWRRFLKHRLAVTALAVLILLVALAFSAPLVAAVLGVDANSVDLFAIKQAPSAAHPLGTDELGRDLLVRLLYGGQVSLLVGIAAALCAAVIGSLIGVIAGYHGSWLDTLLMRLTDGVIALPLLPLLMP